MKSDMRKGILPLIAVLVVTVLTMLPFAGPAKGG